MTPREVLIEANIGWSGTRTMIADDAILALGRAGFVIVPVIPTNTMTKNAAAHIDIFTTTDDAARIVWARMVKAAP